MWYVLNTIFSDLYLLKAPFGPLTADGLVADLEAMLVLVEPFFEAVSQVVLEVLLIATGTDISIALLATQSLPLLPGFKESLCSRVRMAVLIILPKLRSATFGTWRVSRSLFTFG